MPTGSVSILNISILLYDQHRPKDAPGPIASKGWVKANLAHILTQLDAHKLWLGVAGYGYRWQTGKEQAVALPAWYCKDIATQMGITDTYQPGMGNDFLQYNENGKTFTIWWEGVRGMRDKLAVAAENRLAGIALWRLGYEEEEFWE